jgi:hypothetical protein
MDDFCVRNPVLVPCRKLLILREKMREKETDRHAERAGVWSREREE